MHDMGVSDAAVAYSLGSLLSHLPSYSADEGTILYKLPGHLGTCAAVALHPKEPISECRCVFDSVLYF